MTWVSDHVFVAGGDVIPDGWADFQRQTGISVVVSLRAGGPDTFSPPPPLAYLWLPGDDAEGLTLDHWLIGAQFQDAAVQLNRRALVHCRLGLHRTRALYAAYLVFSGKSPKAALREVKQKPWLPHYAGDPTRLEEYHARVQDRLYRH